MTTGHDTPATGRLLAPLIVLAAAVLWLPWSADHGRALSLAVAGLAGMVAAVVWSHGHRRSGAFAAGCVLMLLVSIAATPTTGTAELRGLSVACAPLVAPLAAGALGAGGRWLAAALAGGVLAGVGPALFFDPFLEPSCGTCRPNGLVWSHQPGVTSAAVTVGVLVTVSALVLAARETARQHWGLLGLAVGTVLSAYSVRWTVGAVVVMTVSMSVALVGDLLTRARVRKVVDVLHAGDLETALRSRLRDPRLTVAYLLPDERHFSSSDGSAPAPGRDGQVVTDVLTEQAVVRIGHDPASAVAGLARLLDGPARIALANQVLRVQLAAHETRLRDVRRRLVEQWDGDRRSMERDIHDSAQQQTLSFALEVQHAADNPALDADTRAALLDCLALVRQALDGLREVSHGLYPPSLESRGLAPALSTLAMYSAGNVSVGSVPEHRFPAAVERTIIALVADMAAHGRALHVDVEFCRDVIRVILTGPIQQPSGPVLDRIDVLEGRVERREGSLKAEIPCG